MKLKEIELDLPYKKNMENIRLIQKERGISSQDAIRMDYELNWKNKRNEIRLMTRCMTSMIERIMSPINTKDFRKIIIECVDNCEYDKPKNLLGVLVIQTYFDIKLFYSLDKYGKKKFTIDTIIGCLNNDEVNEIFDTALIINACNKIIDNDYINEWVWKRTVVRDYRWAELVIFHDINELNIFIDFYIDNDLLKRSLIVSTIPDEWNYNKFLGKFEWLSKESVVLVTKEGEKYIEKFG